jgi:lysophospholipase L1-like esterase
MADDSYPDIPIGYGIPLVDLATDLLPAPTVDAIREGMVALDEDGLVPDEQMPERLSEPELSATIDGQATGLIETVGPGIFSPLSSARPGSRFVFLGDSITLGSDSGPNVNRGDAWPVYAALASRWRVGYVKNAGVAGNTTAQMLARFDTDVTPYTPTAVTIAGGMNDATAISLATYKLNIEAIIAKVREIAAVPILVTVTPSNASSRGARIAEYNTWLRRFAAAESIPLLDFWDLLVDPADGGLIAAYDSGDDIHPNAAAHQLMGEQAATQLASILPNTSPPISMSNVDPASILTNSLFLTDSNADGLANDWTAYTVPASGYAFTLTTNAGMKGNAQRITHTAAPGPTWLRQIKTTGYTAGDTIQIAALVQSSGVAASVALQFAGSAGNVQIFPINVTRPTGLVAYVAEFVIPANTTSLQLFLKLAAGTGWAEFGQPVIRNLTTLGVL